ncbi:MAG: hypothetical protein BWY75_02919 [bacterium ADurb.Bin425]|nr:MAG: hypothetical protein BWY75_02919 [bacterium ADurb.Bin425]
MLKLVDLAHYSRQGFFTIANNKEIKKWRHRFWINGRGPASENQGENSLALTSSQRQFSQLKHVEDICIGKLILQRKTDQIEILHRLFRFKSKKRQVLGSHQGFHITSRCISSINHIAIYIVYQLIEYLQPKIGHTKLIQVGKSKSHSYPAT